MKHLLRRPLLLQPHRVVVPVSPLHTVGTHALLVGATVQLEQTVVMEAQATSQILRGRDHPVGLRPAKVGVVDSQVSRAEGQDAHRARLDGRRPRLPPAHAAPHLLGGLPALRAGLQELLHHLSQDGVSAQQGFGVEHLPALRAAVLALLLAPVPEVLDAVQAVAVSAGDRHRVPQNLQAHRTAELVLFDRDRRGCHFFLTANELKTTDCGVGGA